MDGVSKVMRKIVTALFVILNGCTSLEKHHTFNIDRTDASSQNLAVCAEPGKWQDPIRIGTYRFYVQHEQSPLWVGVLFLPIFPVQFNFNEVRLIFGSDVPPNPAEWLIRFDSDGYVAKGQVGSVPDSMTPYQIVFKFPPHPKTDTFELTVPDETGAKKIKIAHEASWKYHPIFLPIGDTFPRWQRCD